ncbi:hypothetical protein ACSFBC_25410 [Variovorax sp. LT1R16]
MMKMISRTSITSTTGFILISFITSSGSSWVPKAMASTLLEQHRRVGRLDERTIPRLKRQWLRLVCSASG